MNKIKIALVGAICISIGLAGMAHASDIKGHVAVQGIRSPENIASLCGRDSGQGLSRACPAHRHGPKRTEVRSSCSRGR